MFWYMLPAMDIRMFCVFAIIHK